LLKEILEIKITNNIKPFYVIFEVKVIVVLLLSMILIDKMEYLSSPIHRQA